MIPYDMKLGSGVIIYAVLEDIRRSCYLRSER